MMQADNHIFKGMRRDNHPSRQDSSFLWDAFNVRLTNRDSDTGFAITNERGTTYTGIDFQGQYMGHCVLNDYLVVFTTEQEDDSHIDRIYRLTRENDKWVNIILFEGNLNFDTNHPLEALGDAETNLINKIYWTDGINQPRVINITAPELKLSEDDQKDKIFDGANLTEVYGKNTAFDFIQKLNLEEEVSIERGTTYGEFAPGVIQYALTYFNKYGQESNIFYVSPLQYISADNRAGSPEEKINNSFSITISKIDDFDYIRVYSIHRTSLDAKPTVKIVKDLNLADAETFSYTTHVLVNDHWMIARRYAKRINCVDTGSIGSIEDPLKLSYVGGNTILAGTIASKDGTMFLGDITLQRSTSNIINILNQDVEEQDEQGRQIKGITIEEAYNQLIESNQNNNYYPYKPVNNETYSPYFKSGETYRCGLQFQFDTGEWSEPIPINKTPATDNLDLNINNAYPWYSGSDTKYIKSLNVCINKVIADKLIEAGIKKVRTCVVFPKPSERSVICQGVLNPTVYSVNGRFTNNPYALSSWYFRPSKFSGNDLEQGPIEKGSDIQYKHDHTLLSGGNLGAEIQSMRAGDSNMPISEIGIDDGDVRPHGSTFAVDSNLVTMHSPEIEYGSIANTVLEGTDLHIIGAASLHSIVGDIDLSINARGSSKGAGFIRQRKGYSIQASDQNPNGGQIASCCYDSAILKGSFIEEEGGTVRFLVYPWHRTGSLDNDIVRNAEQIANSGRDRASILKSKIISNLKYFENTPILVSSNEQSYDITTPQLFSSNEVTGLNIHIPYLNKDVLYYGNADDIIAPNGGYSIYIESGTAATALTEKDTNVGPTSSESVRLKYKSSPHLVFSLCSKENVKAIPVLPYLSATGGTTEEEYKVQDWANASAGDPLNYPILGYIGSADSYTVLNQNGYNVASEADASEQIGSYQILNSFIFPIYNGTYLFKGQNIGANQNRWVHQKSGTRLTLLFKKGSVIWHDYINGERVNWWPKGLSLIRKGPLDDLHDTNFAYLGKDVLLDVKTTGTAGQVEIVSSRLYEKPTVEEEANYSVTMNLMCTHSSDHSPSLPIAELRRYVDPETKFGGKSDEAIKGSLWVPSSEAVSLINSTQVDVTTGEDITGNTATVKVRAVVVPYKYGDTWYTRYDCVKTYPFTDEDTNQIVEIGSFMLESHINLDGRYDTKRGLTSNLSIKPDSYKINDVYSQTDNFFNYRVLDEDYYKPNAFPYQITWSLSKNPAMDVDPWTNITLANTLDISSAKGKITKLCTLNDSLLCFQEKALNQIMFNSRVQVQATDGIPIEIANSGKVDGYRALSSNIGCNNKWSIIETSTGLYFIDKYSNAIYKYGDGITNLSDSLGMAQWVKGLDYAEWNMYNENPVTADLPGVRTFYDNLNGDIYFSPASSHCGGALCFSDKLNQFTSFMSYDNVAAMFNFNNGFYSLQEAKPGMLCLWENFTGPYGRIFDQDREFSITYVSNGDSIQSKVFDTVELEAQVERFNPDYNETENAPYDIPPFLAIRVANDYQDVYRVFDFRDVKKKFNVWRINIPRSSEVASPRGDISRNKFARARIRSPWAKITLYGNTNLSDKVTLYNTSTKYSI